MTNTTQIVDASQMGRLLRVSPTWLKQEAEAGRLPCVQAGKKVLFHPPTVERVLAQRAAVKPSGQPAAET